MLFYCFPLVLCVVVTDKNKEMSSVHHELAILYMPDHEPKALLCKAAMYVESEQYEAACDIYQGLFLSIDDIGAHYQPYVLNNHGERNLHAALINSLSD
jgi:hypothetical protein